jgi:hypothetical protein
MKDELNLHLCKKFHDLENEVEDYMNYYNNDRNQWRFTKMTPMEYGDFLLYGVYPNNICSINTKDDRLYRQSSLLEKL